MEQIIKVISSCIENGTLKKIVLSKPNDKSIAKNVSRLVMIRDEVMLQTEIQYTKGGAKHVNTHSSDAARYIADEFKTSYMQINIVDVGGIAEGKMSKSGKFTFLNKIKKADKTVDVSSQNREKDYILLMLSVFFINCHII